MGNTAFTSKTWFHYVKLGQLWREGCRARHYGAFGRDLIDLSLLSADERGWVDAYHDETCEVSPLLEGDAVRGPELAVSRLRAVVVRKLWYSCTRPSCHDPTLCFHTCLPDCMKEISLL